MPIAPDDPRLTAYALGELDEADRTEVEALIAGDPEAIRQVAEILATARLLTDQFQTETATTPGLGPENLRAIEDWLELPPAAKPTRRRWVRYAVAASVLGMASALLVLAFREDGRPHFALIASRNWNSAQPKEDISTAGQVALPPHLDDIRNEHKLEGPMFGRIQMKGPSENSEADSSQSGRVQQATGPQNAFRHRFERDQPQASLPERNDVRDEPKAAGKKTTFANPDGSLEAAKTPFALVGPNSGGLAGRGRGEKPGEGTAGGGFAGGGGGVGGAGGVGGQGGAPGSNGIVSHEVKAEERGDLEERVNRAEAARRAAILAKQRGDVNTAPFANQPGRKSKLATKAPESPSEQPGQVPAAGNRFASDATKPPNQVGAGTQKPISENANNNAGIPYRTHGLNEPGQVSSPDLEARLDEMLDVDRAQVVPAEASRNGIAFPKNFQELSERRSQLRQNLEQAGGDAFARIVDNAFLPVEANLLSTFSIDVDTASYANVRRYLNQNTRPPLDAVRIEELLNYFPYRYPAPTGPDPFSVNLEVARCPWDTGHRLVRIGLKGREIDLSKRPPSNLVFLIDVSGSMQTNDRLPLLKAGMKLLVDQLGENDRVAMVVYAGSEGLALPSTSCSEKERVLSSLEQLQAGGSTNGGRGIQLAYDIAVQNFIKGGTNRVILATDGDFNVGVTYGPDLDRLIEARRESKVFLSVLGFGQRNVQHDKLESLADKGNGQYSFIDSIKEARKVLVDEMGGTLLTIAKDVKVQVRFNPSRAGSYRLIGYENRVLQARDFADDKKDAGEIGSGHCVTALYEVIPPAEGQGGDDPKAGPELLNVDLRYKAPDGDVSKLLSFSLVDQGRDFSAASGDFKFASSVAGFGMLLRASPYAGSLTWPGLVEMASTAIGPEPAAYRQEFLGLVRKAEALEPR